jgi:hypothetical protein
MVNAYELSQVEEINYDFIKPGLEDRFEVAVMQWYCDFSRFVPHFIPTITDVFDDTIPITSIASDMVSILSECAAIEFCGIDKFPESMSDWTSDHILRFEDEIDLYQYEHDFYADVEKFLVAKNMTYCRSDEYKPEVTYVVGVW